jgi:peroxiredoxin (alkyl hydroperoxide reductase subunit C)
MIPKRVFGGKLTAIKKILLISLIIAIALLLAGFQVSSSSMATKKHKHDIDTGHRSGLKINDKIPDMQVDAYYKGNITKVNLSDHKGKWLVFIFYPADFTYVCPTELEEMASLHKNFTDIGAEVFSVSRDSAYVHKAWLETSPKLKNIQFPMIADTTGNLCKAFGTYNDTDGLSCRASFIFDPEGKLISMDMHDNSFGRNTKELLRKLEAAKFVYEHKGKVCPASWVPGEEAIQPSL